MPTLGSSAYSGEDPPLSKGSFFLLPPEIREIVYTYLPSYITAPKPNAVFTRDSLTTPPLLLTSRQLYLEYLPHLYRQGTLLEPILTSVDFPITWTHPNILSELSRVRIAGLTYNWPTGYVKKIRPRSLNFNIKSICTDIEPRMPKVKRLEIEIGEWDWYCLGEFWQERFGGKKLQHALSTWHNLRTLVIIVLARCQYEGDVPSEEPFVVGSERERKHFEEVVKEVNEQRVEHKLEEIILEVIGPVFGCEHGQSKRRFENYPFMMRGMTWQGEHCSVCLAKESWT